MGELAREGSERLAARRCQLRRAWLLLVVVLVGYTATTVPGARGHSGYNAWIDGWLQNGILGAATLLIAARSMLVRAERLAWASIAIGLGLYTVGNATYFAWVQYQDPLPFPSI